MIKKEQNKMTNFALYNYNMEQKIEKKSFPPIPAALLSMLSVQSGASIAKRLFPTLGASTTSSLRLGLSSILLFLFNRPKIHLLNKTQWMHCLIYGICMGAMNLVFYYAIQRIPLGLGVTVEFLGPLLLALFFSKRALDLLWVLFAALGIALIVPWQNTGVDLLGLLLAFMAGVFWAGYIFFGGKVAQVMNTKDAVTIATGIAALLVLPFGLFSGGFGFLTSKLFFVSLGVAILSSAIPFSLDLIALKQLPTRTFSILTSLQPAFGALSGLLFLNEILTFNQWISILCVIIASLGTSLTRNRMH